MGLTTIHPRDAWTRGGLSWRELVLRTLRQVAQHDTLNRAAVVAFYAMLSLVPFLAIVLAVALGAAGSIAAELVSLSHRFLPGDADALIQEQIRKVREEPPAGLLSFGFVLLVWSASSLFVAVMDATSIAYGVRDTRPWWKRRLLAVLLTFIDSLLLVGATLSIVLWPAIMSWLHLGIAATFLQWVVVVMALLAFFAIAYYFGPDGKREWCWLSPGSTLGTLGLIAATLGFRLYLQYSTSYSETYGALAGVVVTLLWFYFAALALLLGAELNGVIAHAAPLAGPLPREEPPPEAFLP
jgi:membrane protein